MVQREFFLPKSVWENDLLLEFKLWEIVVCLRLTFRMNMSYQLCFVFSGPLCCSWGLAILLWVFWFPGDYEASSLSLDFSVCRVAVAHPALLTTRQTESGWVRGDYTNRLFWRGTAALAATGWRCRSHLLQLYCFAVDCWLGKKTVRFLQSFHFIGFCPCRLPQFPVTVLPFVTKTDDFFWIWNQTDREMLTSAHAVTAHVETALMF